jgi:hypothetical protein
MQNTKPLVPNAGYNSIQYHVLDQYAHAAVLRKMLAKRPGNQRFLSALVERTLEVRYQDCVSMRVGSATKAIDDRLA